LELERIRYFNLLPLKRTHNHEITRTQRDPFARSWFALESRMNEDETWTRGNRDLFCGIYARARKPSR
jgi:hypothetical protein